MAGTPVIFKGFIERSDKLNGYHIIRLPDRIVSKFTKGGKTQRLTVSVATITYTAAIRSDGDGGFYMHIGKRILNQIRKMAGSQVELKLTPDTSLLGFEIPEEFTAVLEQDPEGQEIWASLTTGIQRSLIYYVVTAKQSDTRINRAFKIVEKIKTSPNLPRKK